MKGPRRVAHAYVFQNGMVMAFDEAGEQVPEYQGPRHEAVPKLQRDFPDLAIEGLDAPLRWR